MLLSKLYVLYPTKNTRTQRNALGRYVGTLERGLLGQTRKLVGEMFLRKLIARVDRIQYCL